MGIFHKIKVGERIISPIDWEMSPDLSFGTFESWGGRERVRNNDECVYYFFVDNWEEKPKLCLMERAIKHAIVLAEILAPLDLLENCVKGQGTSSRFEQSYAVNDEVKEWLIANVLDGGDSGLIVAQVEAFIPLEDMGPSLPSGETHTFDGSVVKLPTEHQIINDEDLQGILKKRGLFDKENNPDGKFENSFVDTGNSGTVLDQKTSLLWQRGGLDIGSARTINRNIEALNKEGFAGFNDWRLPTLEEAMSLMELEKNSKDQFLNLCFSKEQPFVFVAAQRKPGGYWFVDYKQGRAFWSSGTIPGGFARLVRSA